jgi:serine protease Do
MLSLFLALAPALPPQLPGDDLQRRKDLRRTPVVEVAEMATPAVVYIQTGGIKPVRTWWGARGTAPFSGSGSGVVIHEDGFIVTNYHVVRDARQISVTFDSKHDELSYPARLISYVESEDLALLKIAHERDFPTIPLGTSSDLMLGESVVAIGNPYGQTHTVSVGIISGLHRNMDVPSEKGMLHFSDLIQTDASINFGNSGGPLLNIHGELIGINSAMNVQAENIGFAIPVDRVREVIEDQLLDPDAARSFLGFSIAPGDDLVVTDVLAGGPAQQAGLRAGDRLLRIQETPIGNQEQYRLARVCIEPQETVRLLVERGGGSEQVSIRPWDKADGILFEGLGLTVQNYFIGQTPFVQIGQVLPGGPAERIGLEPGDLIESVKTPRTAHAQQVTRMILAALASELEPGQDMQIDVYRDLNQDGLYDRSELHRGVLPRR